MHQTHAGMTFLQPGSHVFQNAPGQHGQAGDSRADAEIHREGVWLSAELTYTASVEEVIDLVEDCWVQHPLLPSELVSFAFRATSKLQRGPVLQVREAVKGSRRASPPGRSPK